MATLAKLSALTPLYNICDQVLKTDFLLEFKANQYFLNAVFSSAKFLAKEILFQFIRLHDGPVLDFTGEFMSNMTKGRDYVHACIDISTVLAEANYIRNCKFLLDVLGTTSVSKRNYESLKSFQCEPDEYVYKEPLHCKKTASVMLFNCVANFMPLKQLGVLMRVKGVTRAYGYCLFDLTIFVENYSEITLLGIRVAFMKERNSPNFTTVDAEKNYIWFLCGPAADYQFCYSYSAYKRFLTANYIQVSDQIFMIENWQTNGSFHFFKILFVGTIDMLPNPSEILLHAHWKDLNEEYLVLNRLKSTNRKLRDRKTYQSERFFVRKKMIMQTVCYINGLKENDLNYTIVYRYLRVLNSKVIIDGISIIMPRSLSSDELLAVAVTIFRFCFRMRFDENVIASKLIEQIKKGDVFAEAGLLKMVLTVAVDAVTGIIDKFYDSTFGELQRIICEKRSTEKLPFVIAEAPHFVTFWDVINREMQYDKSACLVVVDFNDQYPGANCFFSAHARMLMRVHDSLGQKGNADYVRHLVSVLQSMIEKEINEELLEVPFLMTAFIVYAVIILKKNFNDF
ncbi:1604_t:CDS:2 [Dentiscutata heterogama]|uniref:1604_t:CDS:1 n=1 Tax=Dentiscutata heterogama TaxID=1316150 RepID=A0ACA9MCE6_9GLOM|nr:1604_t:CDS:2 [Dentiscutata heterogama]